LAAINQAKSGHAPLKFATALMLECAVTDSDGCRVGRPVRTPPVDDQRCLRGL